ncbi:MAG: hypothetical protein IJ493_10220 [Clostridia bacterium]|nr:hypothetical protein [Clostridia bacterium]
MEDMTRSEYGKMLKEIFRDVGIIVLVFVAMVVYVFQSSAHQWNLKIKADEAAAAAKAEAAAMKASVISVYAWVNDWGLVNEERSLEKLKAGVEYTVGQLRQFDVNDKDTHKTGFNSVRFIPDDDKTYVDPIITFAYANFIHVQYSIDSGAGWMTYGETARGLKTNNLQYLPAEELSNEDRDGWGQGMMTVRVPANGTNNIAVNVTDTSVSESLRDYNYFVDEKLGDVYSGVPEEYSNHTRRIWTSHLIVKAWASDPRVKGAVTERPVATIKIRIRYYGAWDLTQEEYDSIVHSAPGITQKEYTPKTTIELIV